MSNYQCLASRLTEDELMRWLNWMDFVKGIEVGHLNDLALVEPEYDEYAEALELFTEWNEWRP